MGAYITLAAMLLFLYNVVRSLRSGKIAGDDPWDARTLEWAIASPPPAYNFAKLPDVAARDDFWNSKYDAKNFVPEPAHAKVHMPDPSIWPLICAIGVGLMGCGFLIGLQFLVVGAVVTLVAAFAWGFEPFEM